MMLKSFGDGRPADDRLVSMRGSGNVRKRITAAVVKAGVKPWPRMFQALRASCEQEWAMTAPQYAVSLWIGHSITVSGKHYANNVPDEVFDRLVGVGDSVRQFAQQGVEPLRNDPQTKKPAEAGFCVTSQALALYRKYFRDNDLEAEGIEPSSRDVPNGSLYMHSRCFNLDAGDGHRQSSPASSLLCLARGPKAESASQPAVLQPA
jgi:hypothetical protein